MKSSLGLTPDKYNIPYTDLKPKINNFLNKNGNNAGIEIPIINYSRLNPFWENGAQLSENHERNKWQWRDCVLVTADLLTLLNSSKNSNHSAWHAKCPAQSNTFSLSVKFLITPESTISTQIPWRTYLRTSTWMMFCRSWKRPGCTRKYRLGYNPENTTN